MGRRQDRALMDNPEIATAYALYVECRSTQLIQVQKEKAGKQVTSILTHSDGYRHLPEPGGMLDQPYRLMRFFSIFQEGEAEAFNQKLR